MSDNEVALNFYNGMIQNAKGCTVKGWCPKENILDP